MHRVGWGGGNVATSNLVVKVMYSDVLYLSRFDETFECTERVTEQGNS